MRCFVTSGCTDIYTLYQSCTILEKLTSRFFIYFFLTLRYILQYEKIQEFSCYAALLLSYGQLTCTDLTSFCLTELCGTNVSGQTVVLPLLVATEALSTHDHVFGKYHACSSQNNSR